MKRQAQWIAAGVAAALAGFVVSPSATAQKASAKDHPKTAWGDPDISGVYAEFTTAPLERPTELGDQEFFTMPRISVLRTFVMNHSIHHRGQLTVYLRLNNVPLPPVYGPTADEQQ